MSFYGLLTLQKNNFELASKLFVTVRKKHRESDAFFNEIRLRRVKSLCDEIR